MEYWNHTILFPCLILILYPFPFLSLFKDLRISRRLRHMNFFSLLWLGINSYFLGFRENWQSRLNSILYSNIRILKPNYCFSIMTKSFVRVQILNSPTN